MYQFPAIVVGGPPHSGKSVLTYSLTQALRRHTVEHYVLRACPDGEGDWSNETPPTTVRLIRRKGKFTDAFVEHVCSDLARRHLPLLVDVGGRPKPEQEAIFDHCTHAILIAANLDDLITWRDLAERHGLAVIAELNSTLTEGDELYTMAPILYGRIAGLERGVQVEGLVFNALLTRVRNLFGYASAELRQMHLQLAPTELVVEADRLGAALGLGADAHRWQPQDLPKLLDYLPKHEPLSLYGRGPAWLYAALSLHAGSAPFYQFDPRLGWVTPSSVQPGDDCASPLLIWQVLPQTNCQLIDFTITDTYLDYEDSHGLPIPALAAGQGVVISGRLPHWLTTGIALAYGQQPWVALYQPPLGRGVVVASVQADYPVGALVDVALPTSTS